MLVASGKPRYLGCRANVPGRKIINRMRHFLALAVMFVVALTGVQTVAAFDVVTAPENTDALNITRAADIVQGTAGKVQLSTAPGEDGIIRRIEVLASQGGTNPDWALFALKNDADVQVDR